MAMNDATIVGIFTAPEERAAVEPRAEVRAVPGRGLEGDRYFEAASDPAERDPTKEVTIISSEGLKEARDEHGLQLEPGEHRRNLVTKGVDLSGLIGKDFAIGEVRLRGLEDNPPCRYLEKLTGKKLIKPLVRHGGIRAQILDEGTIRVGDVVEKLGSS
jgi:MOSC domain-containing protein YiiM